jgi:vacuolar-type H+-ATPase catalytic subunit A/Vma1
MEWWKIVGVSFVVSAFTVPLLVLLIGKPWQTDDEFWADVDRRIRMDRHKDRREWEGMLHRSVNHYQDVVQETAEKSIESHVQEFHIPQQQLMERQARAEEVRAAMKAEVV